MIDFMNYILFIIRMKYYNNLQFEFVFKTFLETRFNLFSQFISLLDMFYLYKVQRSKCPCKSDPFKHGKYYEQ